MGPVPEVAAQLKAELGEGPVWDAAARRLLWVDLLKGDLHAFDPATRVDSVLAGLRRSLGAAVPRARGGYVIATAKGFEAMDDAGVVELLAEVEADVADTRMNDGKCDPQGRFWAGTMASDARAGAGALYRLDPGGSVEKVLENVTISNGMAWDMSLERMYFIDTGCASVDVFDYDAASGQIANRRVLVSIPKDAGMPDGMAIDAEGCLWVALCFGSAVHRYTPEGKLDQVLHLPVTEVTSCAFGGEDLRDLYITTGSLGLSADDISAQPAAGALFVCRPGVVGASSTPFAG